MNETLTQWTTPLDAVAAATRVAVVGCGGSGKTIFARQLGTALDLPIIHLDAHYYGRNWQPVPHDQFARLQCEMVANDRWIIDGNYAATLPIRLARAELVVFLDLPAVSCLWGILRRRWQYRGGQYQATGVYDRITLSFLRYIAAYRRSMRPRVLDLISQHGESARLLRLGSRRESNTLLRQLSALPRPGRHRTDLEDSLRRPIHSPTRRFSALCTSRRSASSGARRRCTLRKCRVATPPS